MRTICRMAALCLLLNITCHLSAQQAAAVDSLKKSLSLATTPREKVELMDRLSRVLMNVNLQEADAYGKQMIQVAEESRDRKLMVDAYLSNGLRCSYFAARGDYTARAIGFYNQAMDIARKNSDEASMGAVYLHLASVYLAQLDKDNALKEANQGFSVIMSLDKEDSLKAKAYQTYGDVYLARNEKKLALQNYLKALHTAEDAGNNALMKDCYVSLSAFYSSIEDYDRAIDYFTLALKKLDVLKDGNVPYQRTIYLTSIGNLYAAKKSTDIALGYFNRSISMADSLQFTNLKIPGYLGLLNQYLRMDQPQKALDYFNSPAGASLRGYLNNFGFTGVTDQAYGYIYSQMGKLDSAAVYFNRAAPYFEKGTNDQTRLNFYAQYADFWKKTGNYDKAIEYYLNVKALADKNGFLESAEGASKHLDSLYTRKGDFKQAAIYTASYYLLKDSVEKNNKEKELAQVEASDEQKRLEKEEKKREEAERARHNIQYMAITIGIAVFFVLLVIMGIFKVSENTIRVLGFFAFIMFFEFIILIADNQIHHWTHGEPWKVLAIKIVLIALLLPLHHWLEHRVIHYLTSHNRLTAAGQHIKSKLFRNRREQHN